MLRCVLLAALLGAASAANPQAHVNGTSADSESSRLLRASGNARAAARVEDVQSSLGPGGGTQAMQESNPEIPDQGPPVQVPAIQPAPWHAIARPSDAICAVSSPALRALQPATQ